MKKCLLSLILIFIVASCSNTPELETGEIKIFSIFEQAVQDSNQPQQFIDARLLLNRKQIDKAKVPVLFVELPSGQNGTLTPYPGRGVGQTWLGADGATLTLQMGVLKASRGMGDDLMGSTSSMPVWSKIKNKQQKYSRSLNFVTGNNKISKRVFSCFIQKTNKNELIEIWGVKFKVARFEENCQNKGLTFNNSYYVDTQGIVRRSFQYHSDTIGYIFMERLDR